MDMEWACFEDRPNEEPKNVLKWLPAGRRGVGGPRTIWCRNEYLGWNGRNGVAFNRKE